MGKILGDLAQVVQVIKEEYRGIALNSYANEAVFCMARSVADKFSEREDVFLFFLFVFFLFERQFRRDFANLLGKFNTTRCHRRRENGWVSFLLGQREAGV